MVQRNYEGVQIAQGGSVQPQASAPLQAPLRTPQAQPSAVAQVLDGLLSFGSQVAKANVDRAAQGAYLQGSRNAALGISEDEIESDFLTRPFTRGGYNMQNYRMEQAALAREMEEFIAREGKAMEPEEFAKVLAQESGSRFQALGEGLSIEDQARAVASQAQLEQNLIGHQGRAYRQYAIEQAAQRFNIQGNQINAGMTRAQQLGDGEAYVQNAERAVGFVYDLLSNDALPGEMRGEVTTQYLQSLLALDHADVVEEIRDSGMLDTLDPAARTKLDNGLRESRARTRARDSLAVLEGNGELQARLANGQLGIEELRLHVEAEVHAKRMTVNEAESMYRAFYKSQSDKDTLAQTFQALMAGDINRLHQLGVGVEEALLNLDQNWAINGESLERRTAKGIQLGMRLGVVPRQFGQQVANAVSAVAANPGDLNPAQVNLLNGVLAEVKQNSATNPAAAQVLLESIPESQRAVMAYAIRAADNGVPPVDAIKTATARSVEFEAMEGVRKRRLGNELREEISNRLDKELGNTLLRKFGRFVMGNARPTQDRWNRAQLEMHVDAELRRLAEDPKNIALFSTGEDAQEALVDLAVTNVRARTLLIGEDGRLSGTPETALVLPEGTTVNSLFGTNYVDAVGRQLLKQYPAEAADFATGFRYDPVFGRLVNVQIDPAGRIVRETVVDQQGIGQAVEAERDRIIQDARDANFGNTFSVPSDAGVQQFNMDGANTAGIGRRAVLQWRKGLVEAEGLRLTAYKDTTGNTTVGVGELVRGRMEVGDTIQLAEAETMFQRSTDEALNAAVRISKSLGVTSDRATLAIAGAVYQLGEQGLGEFRRTAEAIRAGDYEAFVEHVKDSLWYQQTPNRVEHFIREMDSHFIR